ncbi:MAG TPA: diaminopropionate ammonia-lyase [Acidimicrobiales bacterium]|nr:diaminopropionate ammonia-lyase [Acidimicrobiales bacterium]
MTGEILPNPGRLAEFEPRALHPSDDPRPFHRTLPGYVVTPLVDAPELARDLGLHRLWIKVEAERLGLPAFKMLGASWATFRLLGSILEARGFAPPAAPNLEDLRRAAAPLGPLTFAAATDGNHGRAVARMASLLGCAARILVPAGTAPARIEAIESEGAQVKVVDGTYDEAVREAAGLASRNTLIVSDTSWEGYSQVPQWVIDGYRTIFSELEEQLAGQRPDITAVQMGVGALAAAAAEAIDAETELVIVEPASAACGLRSAEAGRPTEVPGPHDSIMAGLNCGNVSPIAWPRVSRRADLFVTVGDDQAARALRDLADIDVVAGETGAAGLAGLRAAIAANALEPAGRTALVICTEGATDPESYDRSVL